MDISLPDDLERFVEEQVGAGGYGSVCEYVSALVRAEQRRTAREEPEGALIAALDSEPELVTDGYWRELREETLRRASARRAARL